MLFLGVMSNDMAVIVCATSYGDRCEADVASGNSGRETGGQFRKFLALPFSMYCVRIGQSRLIKISTLLAV